MKYEAIKPVSKRQAERLLDTQDPATICRTLVRAATTVPDRDWAETLCLRFATHEDPFVRGVVATCLGHVARIYKAIDEEKVIPVVRQLLVDSDPQTRAIAEDTVEDFSIYLGWNKRKIKKLLAA